jgi:hypothetical protein
MSSTTSSIKFISRYCLFPAALFLHTFNAEIMVNADRAANRTFRKNNVRELDLNAPLSGVIFGARTWPGMGSVTVVNSAVTISDIGVLTIEAGAIVQFTSAAAVLTIKGAIRANGRIDAPIIFEGVDASRGSTALYISAHGAASVNVSHAIFRNLGNAVGFECCWSTTLLLFQDSVFMHNRAAVFGYNGVVVVFLRCEFSENDGPITGAYFRFDGCFFHSQQRGAAVGGSTFTDCVFMNHSGAALDAPDATISQSLFVWNDIAIQAYRGPVVRNCILLMNRIGMIAGPGADISGGWLCSLPLNSTSSYVLQLASPGPIAVSGVWFGISGEREAVIRGSIWDIYWSGTLGLVRLRDLASSPTPWPLSLQAYYDGYSSLCPAPQDMGLDLNAPPSGVKLQVSILSSGTMTYVGTTIPPASAQATIQLSGTESTGAGSLH